MHEQDENGSEAIIVIGLTGSIGMGKSTVAEMLGKLGVPSHDSDHEVHELMKRGGAAYELIAEAFPDVCEGGTQDIDRKALGRVVFNDQEQREVLEGILHPLVRQAQLEFIAKNRKLGAQIVALDIPLLFETGRDADVDYTLVVSAPYEVQRSRVLVRDNMTEEKFEAILKTQMPDAEKRQRADYIIDSSVDMDHMFNIVEEIIKDIKSRVRNNEHNRFSP